MTEPIFAIRHSAILILELQMQMQMQMQINDWNHRSRLTNGAPEFLL
jgi:hypothetical protein